MPLSVQQIKFELLSYIKEFGSDATRWQVGTADDAAATLFETLGIDRTNDIWLWKQALSVTAAELVARWMVDRRLASLVATERHGAAVFLFRRTG